MMNKLKVKSKKLKSEKGFTILESLFAIFILSLAIAGVFTAVQQNLSQSIIAKDEVKAFYLAQEAIEVIRNKRDSNSLIKYNSIPNHFWLDGIMQGSGACPENSICTVDANDLSISTTACSDSNWKTCAPQLRHDSYTSKYGYNVNWSQTNFRRIIKINSINTEIDQGTGLSVTSEILVTVRVSWTKGIFVRDFEAKTILLRRI